MGKSSKIEAKEVLRNNKALYIYSLIYLIISVISSFIFEEIPFLFLIFLGVISISSYFLYDLVFKAINNEELEICTDFNKMMKFIKTYLWYLLYGLTFIIPLIISMVSLSVVTYIGFAAGIGADISFQYRGLLVLFLILVFFISFIASIILMFYVTLTYSLAYYISVDNDSENYSAKECMDISKKIMKGHKMEFFVLQLSFIPWILLIMITGGIAGIYVLPYQMLTYGKYYTKLKYL